MPQPSQNQPSGAAQDPRVVFWKRLESHGADFDHKEFGNRVDEMVKGVPTDLRSAFYLHALKCAEKGATESELLRNVAEALKSTGARKNVITILKAVWELPSDKFTHGVTIIPDLIVRREGELAALIAILRAGDLDKLEQQIITLDAGKQPIRARRSLASVVDDFRSRERAGLEPAEEAHLLRAVTLVQGIQLRAKVGLLSLDNIRSAIAELKALPPRMRSTTECREQFLFLADQAVRVIYKIQPYETQLLTAALITDPDLPKGCRGRYAQVKTGEGKSLILALVSSYFAFSYGRVHVLTCNEYLAERDASKFRALYHTLGLINGAFAQPRQELAGNVFAVDVLYTTSKKMIFHLLDSELEDQPFCHGCEPKVGLFDEADNVFVDLVQVLCRKAIRVPRVFERDSLIKILGIIEPIKDSDDAISVDLVARIRAVAPEASHLPDKFLRVWIRSAFEAFRKKRDFHYHVDRENNEIRIIDQDNTGRVLENTQWEGGLHEFVHVRELSGLPKSSGTVHQLSHPRYIRETYWKIYGFSGTFGWISERDELKTQFLLTGFDVPPYWPCQRVDEPLRFFPSDQALEDGLLERVEGNREQGASTVIIVDSVERSRRIRSLFRRAEIETQLLNDLDNCGVTNRSMSEDDILREAGRRGMTLIATNVAGRGADVVPADDTAFVDSVLASEPENSRVEMQARGRAGRMGKIGKSALFVSADDPFFKSRRVPETVQVVLKAAAKQEDLIGLLPPLVNFWREIAGLVDAIEREVVTVKENHIHRVIEDGYLAQCKALTDELLKYRRFRRIGPAPTRDIVRHVVNGPWVHLLSELRLDIDSAVRSQRDLDINDGEFARKTNEEIDRVFATIFNEHLNDYLKARGDMPLTRYVRLVVLAARDELKKAICNRSISADSERIRNIADDNLVEVERLGKGSLKRLLALSRDEIGEIARGQFMADASRA